MNPKVDAYLKEATQWRVEMLKLRELLLDCQLTEELKWAKPCYTFQKGNIAIIIPMKECCALMFCKGALLKDASGVLTKAGENSQSQRWIKFSKLQELVAMRDIVKAYLLEAIEVEKSGAEVKYKETSEYVMPEELRKALDESPALKAAFEALTPGRQRGYLLYFAAPKQSKTRESRIEKCKSRIFNGKGFNELFVEAH
jgi:uncharacterized protein YdeI (YjbR/CyaY-like superfamily)